ncbi:hypothetical protein WL16_24790 [Burkholderia ubonensis]|nr:hypothetical protein WK77_31335 [Burkholderia ubonensis]KVZ44834.1 hypothetical protein WL16_24790 [Burkholderia ubonensis]
MQRRFAACLPRMRTTATGRVMRPGRRSGVFVSPDTGRDEGFSAAGMRRIVHGRSHGASGARASPVSRSAARFAQAGAASGGARGPAHPAPAVLAFIMSTVR